MVYKPVINRPKDGTLYTAPTLITNCVGSCSTYVLYCTVNSCMDTSRTIPDLDFSLQTT